MRVSLEVNIKVYYYGMENIQINVYVGGFILPAALI